MAKAFKIPKTVGGVKIPKELRKKGEALIERANSPEGRHMIAAGLTMAAAAATAADQRNRAPAPPTTPEPPRAGEAPEAPAAPQGIADPMAFAASIGNAVEDALSKMFGAKRPG